MAKEGKWIVSLVVAVMRGGGAPSVAQSIRGEGNKFIVHVTPLNALEVAENSMKGFRDFYKANSGDVISV
ncbi:hypothetical protein LguiA_036720 [Lonicera macranthoides]